MFSLSPPSSSLSTLFNLNPTVHISPTRQHLSRQISSSHNQISTAQEKTQSYWASIEAHLKKTLTIKNPISVHEPMHHFIFSSPRTTAPALCLAACDLLTTTDDSNSNSDQAVSAAAAIHILHAAAYTHEHLPLSDRPSLLPKPKPRPMTNHVYGPNIELLLGDGMVPFGLELIARSDNENGNDSGRVLRVIIEITRAFGSEGLIDGQYSELIARDGDDDMIVSEKKEGVIHACAAACGALLGGGSEDEIKRLKSFGFYVGMIQAATTLYRSKKRVDEFRDLALKELEGFGDENKRNEVGRFAENVGQSKHHNCSETPGANKKCYLKK